MSIYTPHFSVIDEAIAPQPWMQLRQVASAAVASVSKSYDTSGGGNKNDLVQAVQTSWTNNSPVQQWVYGMVTRGGAQVTLQTRSRGYLSMAHGVEIDPLGTGIPMVEVSRFGVGADIGRGGILAAGAAYGSDGLRVNTNTVPLMPHLTGWNLVNPGEKFNARAELRFISEFWENTIIDGGGSATESHFITGDTRIDLYAIPLVGAPLSRMIPTVVGVAYDVALTANTSVNVPAGNLPGDTILAIVANQSGSFQNMGVPLQSGWTALHSRGSDLVGDVHMRMYLRKIPTSGALTTFAFTNDFFAEQIQVLVVLRNVADIGTTDGFNWYVGSNISRWKFVEDQIAPSVDLGTQKLIAASFFSHAPWQAPITQTPPPGMTALIDIPGGLCTMHVAHLDTPPKPTLTRKFTPSQIPIFFGHSITASVLVPGKLV